MSTISEERPAQPHLALPFRPPPLNQSAFSLRPQHAIQPTLPDLPRSSAQQQKSGMHAADINGARRQVSPGRSPTSPRSVRSAPSSPSGRALPPGLAPLSLISPIQLATALDGTAAASVAAAAAGAGAAHNGGWTGQNRPGVVAGPSRAVTVPLGSGALPRLPNSGPDPSTSNASLSRQTAGYTPLPVGHTRHVSQPIRGPNATGVPNGLSRQPLPSRVNAKYRSRSRPIRSSVSSGSETETGIESDTTVRPGRLKTQSLSQPDLVALRNRLEGWAGDVAAQQQQPGNKAKRHPGQNGISVWRYDEPSYGSEVDSRAQRPLLEKRRSSYGKKTPPHRPATLPQNTMPTQRTPGPTALLSRAASRSYPSLAAMRALSPRSDLQPLTPASPGLTFSPPDSPRYQPIGGMTSSEDADDDFSTDSPSSGSLSFSPKRREIRRRIPFKERNSDPPLTAGHAGKNHSGLGLVFDSTSSGAETVKSPSQAKGLHAEGNLFSLRLLAVLPAVWGYLVLMQAVITGGIWVNLYPWGIDTSREALDRVITGWGFEGIWASKSRGDMLLAAVWAVLTGHYCFDMTTGLTHRWRVYYDLPATITRLLSIQCICWPLTGLTLWVLGPDRILFAWVTIGCTTAASRSVQMYVTSNIPSALLANGTGNGNAGDSTPRRRASPALHGDVASPHGPTLAAKGDSTRTDTSTGRKWLHDFQADRHWDWAAVAAEVGYKLGVLLLLTNAWLFWGIESGRLAAS